MALLDSLFRSAPVEGCLDCVESGFWCSEEADFGAFLAFLSDEDLLVIVAVGIGRDAC